jgi:hypothetical protein
MGGAARERGAKGSSRIFAQEYGLEGSRVNTLDENWEQTPRSIFFFNSNDVVPVE